jgi:hypothetical protein
VSREDRRGVGFATGSRFVEAGESLSFRTDLDMPRACGASPRAIAG